jgi:hypothetical protein
MEEECTYGEGAYDLDRFHHGIRPEITREQPDPEESRLLRQLGQSRLNIIGGLVFALYHCQRAASASERQNTSPTLSQNQTKTHVQMRHIIPFPSQLLPRRQRMQDQMLERRDLIRRSSDVNQLLRLLLRSSHRSEFEHVFEEIGHAEDGVGALCSSHQYFPVPFDLWMRR